MSKKKKSPKPKLNVFEDWIEDFEQKLKVLQRKIHEVRNTNSEEEKEIRREMELLANEFGLTVWYEAKYEELEDTWAAGHTQYYKEIRWDVFIPNNFDKETVKQIESLHYGLRSFMFGESEGNEQGCWISSHNC